MLNIEDPTTRYRIGKLLERCSRNEKLGSAIMLDEWETSLMAEVLREYLSGLHSEENLVAYDDGLI